MSIAKMNTATIEHESSILERIVINPDAAQAVLSMRFSAADELRMHELMDKNNREVLDPVERAEMEAFRRIGSFLAIAQAKARSRLSPSNEGQANGQ